MAEPRITVIIPTYNRAAILEKTVRALCKEQEGDLPDWELIVVNDGSTDNTGTLLQCLRDCYGERLLVVEQENLKQGAARNNGMHQARGELFVFLGDDIIPGPEFLANHWYRFVADGRPDTYAAIGRTYWHPEIKQTPFLDWINDWGLQFGFRLIENPDDVPFNFFYTSNLAFSRHLYDELGGFDELFKEYGWEDIELGYRYKTKGGMQLRYIECAPAYHHHQISVTGFCQRQFKVGYSAVSFYRMHPELNGFLKFKKVSPGLPLLRPIFSTMAWMIDYFDRRFAINLNNLTEVIMWYYYFLGMYHGQQKRSRPR